MRPSAKQVLFGLLCAAGCMAAEAREPNFGDLVVGFTEAPTIGASVSIEIDIGQASLYMDAAPGIYPVANLAADFKQAFGIWASQRIVSFGVVGTDGSNVWASSAEPHGSAPGTAAAPYLGSGPNSYQSAVSDIDVLYGMTNAVAAFGGAETRTLADIPGQTNPLSSNPANSFVGILSFPFSGSFNSELSAGGVGFGIPTPPNVQLGAVATGGFQTASVDLYELLPTTPLGSDQSRSGYFTLNNLTGELTYTAVPEPALTPTLIAMGAMAFVVVRRRVTAAVRA